MCWCQKGQNAESREPQTTVKNLFSKGECFHNADAWYLSLWSRTQLIAHFLKYSDFWKKEKRLHRYHRKTLCVSVCNTSINTEGQFVETAGGTIVLPFLLLSLKSRSDKKDISIYIPFNYDTAEIEESGLSTFARSKYNILSIVWFIKWGHGTFIYLFFTLTVYVHDISLLK